MLADSVERSVFVVSIDVDNIDVHDLDTLQHTLNRAVERRNMRLFSPVGNTRDHALTTQPMAVEAHPRSRHGHRRDPP